MPLFLGGLLFEPPRNKDTKRGNYTSLKLKALCIYNKNSNKLNVSNVQPNGRKLLIYIPQTGGCGMDACSWPVYWLCGAAGHYCYQPGLTLIIVYRR
ncbi:hypothetical protein BH10BAC3_BH10BAC3_30190 [soil metagenome]